jgi:hypothetical protein
MSQTIRQLTNFGYALTRQLPIVPPLQVNETSTDGVVAQAAPPLDTLDRNVRPHYVISLKQSSTYGT